MTSVWTALAFSTDMRQEKWALPSRLAGNVLNGLKCLPHDSLGKRVELIQVVALLNAALRELEKKDVCMELTDRRLEYEF